MKFSSFALAAVIVSPVMGFAPQAVPAKMVWVTTENSITISQTQPPSALVAGIDKEMLKGLELETKAAEKEAKVDERKARVEKSREAFFEYEAKQASIQEALIEAAEQRALAEAAKDKQEAEKLKMVEQKAQQEIALAKTKQERAAKQKEIRVSWVKDRWHGRSALETIKCALTSHMNLCFFFWIHHRDSWPRNGKLNAKKKEPNGPKKSF